MDNNTLITVNEKQKSKTSFDVDVETSAGAPVLVFKGIEAQTKSEAINKAKQKFVFSAERVR